MTQAAGLITKEKASLVAGLNNYEFLVTSP
jgi:hypothetical protein